MNTPAFQFSACLRTEHKVSKVLHAKVDSLLSDYMLESGRRVLSEIAITPFIKHPVSVLVVYMYVRHYVAAVTFCRYTYSFQIIGVEIRVKRLKH